MAIPNSVCVCVVLFSVSAVLWLFLAACISISIRLPLYVQGRGMGGGRVVRMALVNLPGSVQPTSFCLHGSVSQISERDYF